MRIENLREERSASNARVAATVIWEDCDQPTREVYFETDAAFAQDLSCNPHAFLVGSIIPAMRHGEARIAIDETICPELRNGLLTAMGWLCTWYGAPRKPVRIEAREGVRAPLPRADAHAGSFLSGGLDSLAMLRMNRLDFPLDHPHSIKDCLVVEGFDIGGVEGADLESDRFEHVINSLIRVAEDADVVLIPVSTNVRHLDDDVGFWMYEFHGAALASVAHSLSKRLRRVSIGSSYDLPSQEPWGSHPLLDPAFGSAELRIAHSGSRFTRLEKARVLAGWDVALEIIRTCTENPRQALNCGRCEKCVRTMLELLAAGCLDRASAFPSDDVSRELLEHVLQIEQLRNFVTEYSELIEPLTEQGRSDLVEVIQERLGQLDKYLAWEREQDWKGGIKRFDRRYLRSALFSSYKAIRGFTTGEQSDWTDS
jgi:hypothetical protein